MHLFMFVWLYVYSHTTGGTIHMYMLSLNVKSHCRDVDIKRQKLDLCEVDGTLLSLYSLIRIIL